MGELLGGRTSGAISCSEPCMGIFRNAFASDTDMDLAVERGEATDATLQTSSPSNCVIHSCCKASEAMIRCS